MMIRRTIGAVVLLALLSGAALSGTAFAQSEEPTTSEAPSSVESGTTEGSTFIFGDTSEPSSLNPIKGYKATDYTIWAMSYDIPINYNTQDFGPDLEHSIVTGVDAADDGMSFTYHLRPNMKWSDGEPFTADDVVWTLNYYKDEQIANYVTSVQLMDHAELIDDTTFVLHSTKPTTVFNGEAAYLYTYILPKHIWADLDQPAKFNNVPAVGSGPYVITDYTKGDTVTLEQNPYYWGREIGLEPHVDTMIYKNFKDENQEAAALEKGEIDFGIFDSPNTFKTLGTKPGVTTHAATTPFFHELAFNTGSAFQPATKEFEPRGSGSHAAADPKFRRAIRMAVDNQMIIDKVLQGYGVSADTPVPPNAKPAGVEWHPSDEQRLDFNLDDAKQALTDAGYVDTDDDGIVNDPETGENVILDYKIRSENEITVKTAPYVEEWLKNIGVGVKIQALADDPLYYAILDGDYDLFHWGWFPGPDPEILSVLTCDERGRTGNDDASNDSFFCNEEYDKLYKEQLTVTDTQERIEKLHRMQEILYEEQPYIMLFYPNQLQAYRSDRFTDFIQQPADGGDLLAAYGPFSFISIRPVDEASGNGSDTSSSSGGIPPVVWIIIGVVVVAAGGFLIARSRRGSEEDRA